MKRKSLNPRAWGTKSRNLERIENIKRGRKGFFILKNYLAGYKELKSSRPGLAPENSTLQTYSRCSTLPHASIRVVLLIELNS
jgi:hypothetical protein